jgi:hypothetical protein
MSRKSPWWQTTKTVRQGLLLGGGFVVLGLSELVLTVTGAASAWLLVIAVGFLAIGGAHLASAAAMRKRQGSTSVPGDYPPMRDSTPRPSDP